jgi:hypothetical protein
MSARRIGSSNIQILPSNRYLCIIPGRAPKETDAIKLPFAGDSLLSIILSKAFLLADEVIEFAEGLIQTPQNPRARFTTLTLAIMPYPAIRTGNSGGWQNNNPVSGAACIHN